jgi:outer membrane protein TolC
MNLRMIASGTLAAVERAASEAELERRRDTYFASLETVQLAENKLKQMLSGNRNSEIWGQRIVPSDEAPGSAPPTEEIAESLKLAIEKRPELRVLNLQREINTGQQQLADNLRKPGLNFVLNYIQSGIGGQINSAPNPFAGQNVDLYRRVNVLSAGQGLAPIFPPDFGAPPDSLVGGYGTALGNLFRARFPTVSAGVSFDLNLRNRSAEGLYEQATLTEKQLRLEAARLEQGIQTEVRNAIATIRTARQRITAADASARAAQEKLESELRLFGTGESTNFLVLTRQNELADSRTRAINSRFNLYQSMIRLSRATGTMLDSLQIVLK